MNEGKHVEEMRELHAQAVRTEFDHIRVAVRVREGSQFGAVWDAVLDLQGELANTKDRLATAEEELRVREQSQIPVIPKAAQARLDAAEKALAFIQAAASSWHVNEAAKARALSVIADCSRSWEKK